MKYSIKKDKMMKKEIESKYKNLFMLLDLDWNGYVALMKLKNEELNKVKK